MLAPIIKRLDLWFLLFEEVVEPRVSVGVSHGAVIDVSLIMTLGASQISLLPFGWQVPEYISDP